MADRMSSCKVCGAACVYLCETPCRHVPRGSLRHYRCTDCGLVFIGDRITEEQLAAAYAALDTDKYYEEIETENRRKMEYSIRDIRRTLRLEGLRILDIGTGNGAFPELLLKSGATSVAAHELPGADLSRLTRMGCSVYLDCDYASIPDNGFDLITMLDVLEHVASPGYVLQACRLKLAEGGHIYIHTPVVTRLDKAMHLAQKNPMLAKVGRMWQSGRTSIYHLQIYTKKSIAVLLAESGLDVVSLRFKNELSWPLARYVRGYFCGPLGLPRRLSPVLAPLFYPFLRTNTFNANKAVLLARRRD